MAGPYSNFEDFVGQNHYQSGPHAVDAGPGEPAHTYALSVAKEIADHSIIQLDSVAVNQTFNIGITALAENDPSDPMAGRMNYAVFLASPDNPRTCVFTENITVQPDGTIQSQMEQGKCFSWMDRDEREAFYRLSEQFGIQAAASPSAFRDFARANGLALGGEDRLEGQYKIEHGSNTASISSASPVNQTTGVEIENIYGVNGDSAMQLSVFRENAGAIMKVAEASAPGPQSPDRYQAFSQMNPGIGTYQP